MLTAFIHRNSSTLIRTGSLLIDCQLDWSWPPLVRFFAGFLSATVPPKHANQNCSNKNSSTCFYQSLQRATCHPSVADGALFAQEYKARFETALQEGISGDQRRETIPKKITVIVITPKNRGFGDLEVGDLRSWSWRFGIDHWDVLIVPEVAI